MKTTIRQVSSFMMLTAGLLLAASSAQAVNYPGNGDGGFGGPVGQGTLSVTDDGTNLTFNLQRGPGNLSSGNDLVIYIDTGSGEYGYTNTSGFTSTGGEEQISISGYAGGSQRSVMNFTNGFSPNYAVVIKYNYMDLWSLANPANLSYIDGTSEGGSSSANFSFTFNCSEIELTANTTKGIKLFGTLISNTAYRSTEAIAGNDYSILGGQGDLPFGQTAYVIYNFAAPPAPSYPVSFSVDMTEEIALGNFNPGNGDTVSAAGTFQTNAWTGFQLTNNPAAANTNIYSGTYLDYNPTNTAEQFKFTYFSVSGNDTVYEDQDNRPFTLTAPGVTNALVYFADVYPTPSATTNNLSFSIDMTVQLELNHFNPANGDQIEVFGTLENPKWSAGGFILTNNPTSSASNIYSGTIADGNYPGSFENYKFVIVQSGGNTYESGNNRDFFTPTNQYTFPLAYFDNVLSAYSTPVTFSVDMTDPLFTGAFNPGNGDLVYAAGTFQTNHWDIQAFMLTNNPSAANTNIYSGTYNDPDAPGTGEQYLFIIMSGGQTNYESIPNRIFYLPATATNLPLALWSDLVLDTNNYLSEATTITFTVDMTNAVDDFGYPFEPDNDAVVIDGDFMNPTWPNFWTDPLLGGFDYTANLLQNSVTNLLYTGTFSVPAGHGFEVQYKYGIIHNYSGTSNTNCDNEASYGRNHTRYIRANGTYNFPVDIFGIQQTNLAAATEPSFGNLTIGGSTGGQLPLSWLGRPGVYLQYSTNLAGPWVQLPATDGTNASSWAQTNPSTFFRLVNP